MSGLSYDAYQQVFALSAGSNLVRTDQTLTEYELQQLLLDTLTGKGDWIPQNVGPGWSIVWGPAVWRSQPGAGSFPDNVWFIAKNDSFAADGETPTCTYVVAIAATAGNIRPVMSFDWEHEDFAVAQVVDLENWCSLPRKENILPVPNILAQANEDAVLVSQGTAKGLWVLATQPPSAPSNVEAPSDSVPLPIFLQNLAPPANSKLIFTGHSLGGALSPALGVLLSMGGYLDKFGTNILVYPTAGPTPGNKGFVSQYTSLFPAPASSPSTPFYQRWNQNIVNVLDVVPHAWCTDETQPLFLQAIPRIYGDMFLNHPIVTAELDFLDYMLRWKDYASGAGENVYRLLPLSTFTGSTPPIPGSLDDFRATASAEHTDAYGKAILNKTFPDSVVGSKEDDPLRVRGIVGAVSGKLDLSKPE